MVATRALARLLLAALAVTLTLSPSASHAPRVRIVHGARSPLWAPRQRADPDRRVAFTLALHTEKSPRELDALVRAVSDVASPRYGQFLSADELARHYAPSAAARQALQAFVDAHRGGHDHGDDDDAVQMDAVGAGDFVTLRMRAATAEKLFATALVEYAHAHDASLRVVRPHAEGFAVPAELQPHVLFIDGLESFPTPQQAQFLARRRQDGDPFAIKSLRDAVSNRDVDVLATPAVLRQQYDVPGDRRHWNATHPRNKVVVSAFLYEHYTERDLQQFLSTFESKADARDAVAGNFKFPTHRGDCIAGVPGSNSSRATGEASLDVQVVVGLSRSENVEVLCYQSLRDPKRAFGDDNQEPFLDFMEAVNAMEPAPAVVSISYTDEECAVPDGYRDTVNREFMKAALKGISIIISAGDNGVQGSHMSSFCGIEPCSQFVAMFPASSPYVTAVGATTLDANRFRRGAKYAERVTSAKHGELVTSGGGFSAVYAQPAYQKEAVRGYLKYADDHNLSPLFNAQGRAYPDVAALGHSFPVCENGKVWRTDGTSVSAPIVASLVALLNKQRLDKGQPVLGFLNPLIYKLYDVCPHVFEDITDGDIACGGRGEKCCAKGHAAIDGWDAASGVGTIKLATLARDLDSCIDAARTMALLSEEVLLQQPISLLQRDTTTIMPVEQIGLVVTMVAVVALFSSLLAMRGNVFPGRSFFEFQRSEPARERLLGGHN